MNPMNIENPEIKMKKTRQKNRIVVCQCEAVVWIDGTNFGQCHREYSLEGFLGQRFCSNHSKKINKIAKKPTIGKFFVEYQYEIHGIIGETWSCLPCITTKTGKVMISEEVFVPPNCQSILFNGNLTKVVPWRLGDLEDKKNIKKELKEFVKYNLENKLFTPVIQKTMLPIRLQPGIPEDYLQKHLQKIENIKQDIVDSVLLNLKTKISSDDDY